MRSCSRLGKRNETASQMQPLPACPTTLLHLHLQQCQHPQQHQRRLHLQLPHPQKLRPVLHKLVDMWTYKLSSASIENKNVNLPSSHLYVRKEKKTFCILATRPHAFFNRRWACRVVGVVALTHTSAWVSLPSLFLFHRVLPFQRERKQSPPDRAVCFVSVLVHSIRLIAL